MDFINVTNAIALDKLIREFDQAIGRIGSYKRLHGRSNDPYEKVAITTLIATEKIEAASLRRSIDELTKGI